MGWFVLTPAQIPLLESHNNRFRVTATFACHQHISVVKKAMDRSGASSVTPVIRSTLAGPGCNRNDAKGRAIVVWSDVRTLLCSNRVRNERRSMSKHRDPSLSLSLMFCPSPPSVSSSISAPTLSLLSLSLFPQLPLSVRHTLKIWQMWGEFTTLVNSFPPADLKSPLS